MADARRRMEFRRCLHRLSNQLSIRNLEDMKFVCKDHVPVARMERVRGALDLFQALEERGELSMNDTSFLVKVLIGIERANLVEDLIASGFARRDAVQLNQPAPPPLQPDQYHQQQPQRNRELLFNEMLLKIAQNLGARDVEALTFTMSEPLGMNSDRISSATHLFQLLQQRGILSQTDLRPLYSELESIGRSDLCKRINNYLQEIGQPPCQINMDGEGRPMNRHTHVTTGNTIVPEEETQHTRVMASPLYLHHQHHPGQQSATDYQQNGTQYGFTEGGQPISTPSDTSGSTMLSSVGVTYTSDLPSSQLSYPSSESSSSSTEPSTQRAQSGQPDCHKSPQVTFVPQTVYPIAPKTGLAVEETMGQDVSLQKEPFGLTFPPNEDEEEGEEGGEGGELGMGKVSLVEVQDIKKQWNQTQELLTAKEQERNQLRQELDHLQELNARIIQEKEGENLQHEANERELETALQKKIDEIELLRQQVQGLQHAPRQAPEMNPDEFYPLNKNPHGVCLIINNHRFYHDTDPSKAHPDRGGAEIDQYNLTQTFRYLRYKVEVHENLTADQMTDALMRMSQRDHSLYDSFICCILSHGEHDIIHGSNSEPVNVNDLTGLMKLSATLRNKPKLFFIQCCRGEAEERGFEKDNPGESTFRSTIPRDADFFLGYATPLGKAAYRSRKHGSWYISNRARSLRSTGTTTH